MNRKELTIGYLASNIETNVGRQIWAGINDAALDSHVNFICIPGGRIKDNRDFMHQGNILYDLVTGSSFDGMLCWVSSLSSHVSFDEVVEFHTSRFEKVPLIALGQKLPGRTGLVIESFKGMYKLMSHLIEDHGYTKIAHIPAMENHPYTKQRYQAYVKALEDHGLTLRPELVSPYGEWLSSPAQEAMDLFLGTRNLKLGEDIQCITCTSDIQAFGVMNYCRDHNISIPGDLALAGFNGVEEGGWSNPPLTSVKGPFYKQGYKGMKLLLDEIRTGEVLDTSIVIESEPVIRQSCGCQSEGILSIPEVSCQDFGDGESQVDSEELLRDISSLLKQKPSSHFESSLRGFIKALEKDLLAGTSEHSPVSLAQVLLRYYPEGFDLFAPQKITSLFMKWVERYSLASKGQGVSLLFRLNAVANELSLRSMIQQQNQLTDGKRLLNEMGQDVLTSRDRDELMRRLHRHLQHLGVSSCYLFEYKNPENPLASSRLTYEYVQGKVDRLYEEGDYFSSVDFIDQGNSLFRNSHRRFVLEPLYHETRQLGFALFEVDLVDGELYRSLARYISYAFDGILLISQLQETKIALEESYSQVEKKVELRTNELLSEIKERKELEERLQQSQKMEAIGRLAGGIAHDFNNLLTAINGSVEMIESLEAEEDGNLYLDIIKDAGDRAADLVKQLLMFSRKQMIKPVVINVNENIQGLQKILDRLIGEDVDLSLELSDHELLVEIDKSQFEQIIMNLVINGRDAMPSGGSLQMRTSLTESPVGGEIESSPNNSDEHYIRIQIEDNGEGISQENLDKIFEPFFTTKELGKGTGMGLATVYGIVKQNSGEIQVDSQLGEYTRFSIFLPLAKSGKTEQNQMTGSHLPGGRETVLYVEDEKAIRSLMTQALTRAGYNVITAINGIDALAKVDGQLQEVHVLLTDVVMPHMGGRQLADEILKRYPKIKVIFASGYTYDSIISSGKMKENVNFIGKPFSPRVLLKYMRQVLDGEE